MIELSGACHCGNISYTLDWPLDERTLPARRCGCTFCTRIDGVWTSHPEAKLMIKVDDAEKVSRYQFGTRTADFVFCSACGTILIAECVLEGRKKAVVNVHTLARQSNDNQESELIFDLQESCFDGETVEQRLQRRSQRWIGEVVYV